MGLDQDDIQALIAILQKGLSKDDDDSSDDMDAVLPKTKKTRPKAAVPKKKKSANKFERMAEFTMCKDVEFVEKKIKSHQCLLNLLKDISVISAQQELADDFM